MEQIRNFCIIAHIDHGKSTLADRFLELTSTIEKRKMREQFLDQMDLEREKGITIKMTPVRMIYKKDLEHILNLIDTPGHIDFSYEVSRALAAVEGAILLVDATQGVEAQTITVLAEAKKAGLTLIPAVNKIDLASARILETKEEICRILKCQEKDILEVSAKTGKGVKELLEAVIERIPAPTNNKWQAANNNFQALIFDSKYSTHKGATVFVRVFNGCIKKAEVSWLSTKKIRFENIEVGIFTPDLQPVEKICSGEIAYISTNIKAPELVRVGDTIVNDLATPAIIGYLEPKPVVWVNIFPESADDFDKLKNAFNKLKLNDAALSIETESFAVLGRNIRCGFLGMLHLEIILERIKREFGINLIVATPTVAYKALMKDKSEKIFFSANNMPDKKEILETFEPYFKLQIISRLKDIAAIMKILQKKNSVVLETKSFSEERILIIARMSVAEAATDFFDLLKNISQGYASFSYEFDGYEKADLGRLDIIIAGEIESALSKIVSKHRLYQEARNTVDRLYKLLPRQIFALKIQAMSEGKIIASQTLPAFKKNVTSHLYGGDRTRKIKLWQKQKKGKKRLQEAGRVKIPYQIFLQMLKKN